MQPQAAALAITNSILSSNTNGNCVGSSVTNGGLNISDDATCGFGSATGANGQTIGDSVNSMLDPNGLLYNGGPTQTIGLQASSPAIAAIATGNCPAADQRGATRPAPGQDACDIGAFELGGVIPSGGAPVEYYIGSAGVASSLSGSGSPESITVNSTTGVTIRRPGVSDAVRFSDWLLARIGIHDYSTIGLYGGNYGFRQQPDLQLGRRRWRG